MSSQLKMVAVGWGMIHKYLPNMGTRYALKFLKKNILRSNYQERTKPLCQGEGNRQRMKKREEQKISVLHFALVESTKDSGLIL